MHDKIKETKKFYMTGQMSFKCLVLLSVLPRVIFRTKTEYYGGAFLQKCNRFLAVNYFQKKDLSQIFNWVSNTPLLSVKNKEMNYLMLSRRQMLSVNVQFLETLNKLCG